jgi:hypothetical protein
MTDPRDVEALRALESVLGEEWARLDSLESGLAEEAGNAKTRLNTLLDMLAAHRQQMESVARNAREHLDALKAALSEDNAESAQVSKLREEVAQLTESAARYRARAEALEANEETLRRELASMSSEKDTLAGQAALLRDEAGRTLEEAQREAEQLREQLAWKSAEMDALREQHAALLEADETESLRQELAAARTLVAEMEERLRDELGRGTKSVLAEQLADALKEVEDLRAELRGTRAVTPPASIAPAPASAPSPLPISPAPSSGLSGDDRRRIEEAAASLKDPKRTIGDILVQAGLLDADQLAEAQEEQRRAPQAHLGGILVTRGLAGEAAVACAAALQGNVPLVKLEDMTPQSEAIQRISGRLAHQHRCVPLRLGQDSVLVAAMENPLDLVAIEDLERASGCRVEVVVASASEIRNALAQCYPEE